MGVTSGQGQWAQARAGAGGEARPEMGMHSRWAPGSMVLLLTEASLPHKEPPRQLQSSLRSPVVEDEMAASPGHPASGPSHPGPSCVVWVRFVQRV